MPTRSSNCLSTVLGGFSLWRPAAFASVLCALSAATAFADGNLDLWLDGEVAPVPDAPLQIEFADRPNVDTLTLVFQDEAFTWGGRLVLVRSGHANWRVVSVRFMEDGSDIVLAAGENDEAGEVRLDLFAGSEEEAWITVVGALDSFTLTDDTTMIPTTPRPESRRFRLSTVFDWPE